MDTQNRQVLQFMREHRGITSMEAFDRFGITRLSGRIFELRREGYDIETVNEESKNRYGRPVRYARYILHERQ